MSTPAEIRAIRLARLEAERERQRKHQEEKQLQQSKNGMVQPPIISDSPQPVAKPLNINDSKVQLPLETTSNGLKTPSIISTSDGVQKRADPGVSFERWRANEMKRLLSVTLNPEEATTRLIYLQDLRHELDSIDLVSVEDPDVVLTTLLFEIGVKSQFGSPLKYLFQTWTLTSNSRRTLSNSDTAYESKIGFYNEVLRLCSGYASIIFYEPDTFIDEPSLTLVIDDFLTNIEPYFSFWLSILNSIVENDCQLEFLDSTLPIVSSSIDYCSDYNTKNPKSFKFDDIMLLIESLTKNKSICSHIHLTNHFNFGLNDASSTGLSIELNSFLGRILRVSPLLPTISEFNYQGLVNKSEIRSINQSIESTYLIQFERFFSMIDSLIRVNADSRLSVLRVFANLINKNHLRMGENPDYKVISSDSLMLNMTWILIRLSEPILRDGQLSKINKISIDYLNYSNTLIDLDEETKINSTIEEFSNEYKEQMYGDEKQLNFISECFFLMLTFLHYGLGGMINSYKKKGKLLKRLKDQLKEMNSVFESKGLLNTENEFAKKLIRSRIDPIEKKINSLSNDINSCDMYLQSRTLQLEVFDSVVGICEFLVRLIDSKHEYLPKYGNFLNYLEIPLTNFDDSNLSGLDDLESLRQRAPAPFKYYPEIFVEGVVNYCHFITRFNNNPMINNENRLNKLVEFSIIILRCPELISNPHLKARLTEVLFFGSLPMHSTNSGNEIDGFMIPIFNDNPKIEKNLLISLIYFYIMVEKTGSSSQFYDKFNSRYHISFIIEKLWKFEHYKRELWEISTKYQKLFIKFIARMLNDTTYLMDESLNHLQIIHSCQKEINNRKKGIKSDNDMAEETDEDLQKKLDESERMAKSFVQLSNKTILLFNLFTNKTPKAFTIIEIVDRLASMLNYNLVVLVGPKYNQLKVSNPEKYQFDPKELLFQLLSIFVNLSKQELFVEAVARDLRSYNKENFEKAIQIMKKNYKIPNDTFEANLIEFINNVENVKSADEEEELELGDVPDEFLDPLMYTLMKDPVKLPSSSISIDRSVLKAHLMNDPTDPFNRMPLKMEDVIDDSDLRERIAQWRSQQRAKRVSHVSPNTDALDAHVDGDGDIVM